MATIRNTRDKILQAQSPRNLNPSLDKVLFLTTDSPVFNISASNVGSPAVINFTAKLLNIFGTPTFTVTSGSATLTGTGNTRALAYSDMSSDSVTVSASVTYQGITYTALQIVSKVRQGSNGLTNAIIYAYQRSATIPTLSPGAITYDFTSATITVPAGDALANGWSKSIPSGSDPLYITGASASGNGGTDNIAANEWSSASLFAVNGENGVNGLNVATVRIYQKSDSTSPPALPSNPVGFTFSTGAVTGLNNGWSSTVPSGSGAYLYTSSASAASTGASDTIQPNEWATVSVLSEAGINGTNTAQAYAYKRSATVPTDSPGAITYTFSSASITTPSGNNLLNGWTKTIPSGSDPLYVKVASASSIDATDTIGSNEWTESTLLVVNGADGVNSATVYIYQRTLTNTTPALPSANVTYTFSTATSTGLNNNWSTTIPGGTGDYLFVSTATAVSTSNTDVILPSEWAAAQILGTKGANGAQGSSARVAYVLVNSSSLNSTPPSATVSGDSLPATGTWGETNTWQTTSPTSYVAGQSVWVSNGLYNPVANTTTWNVPYLANLKVGSLSIITPNLGSITQGALNINNRFVVLADGTTTISSADSGARTIYNNTGVKVYDGVATLPRVELGLLS